MSFDSLGHARAGEITPKTMITDRTIRCRLNLPLISALSFPTHACNNNAYGLEGALEYIERYVKLINDLRLHTAYTQVSKSRIGHG